MNNDALIIFIVAGVFSYVVFELNRRWGGVAFQREHGERLKEIQKEMTNLSKSSAPDTLEKMNKIQGEFSSLMMKSMMSNFKTLIFTLPLLFITLYFLGNAYHSFLIHVPVNIKGLNPFGNFDVFSRGFIVDTVYGYRGFFLITGMAFGFIMQNIYTRFIVKKKKKEAVQPVA
ncbi:Uncharacterised protein [uncultured archaeon]|nr:Uncharacterised protein [uncultured archaeon]